MLHAGLDLSRRKIDVCLLSAGGEVVEEFASPLDGDGLVGLARRVGRHGLAVRGVIESMTGSRFVHDRLEELGWDVLIADAAKVKGLAPLACKTDMIDARVLAVLSHRDLVPAIWLPDPRAPRARAGALSPASGQTQVEPEEPRPLDDDHLRAPVPGDRSVRRRRASAAGPSRGAAAVARLDRRES
jgi:hypothetical protein